MPIHELLEELKLEDSNQKSNPLSAQIFDFLFAFMYEYRFQEFNQLEEDSV